MGAAGLTGLHEVSLVKIDCDLCVLAHLCVDRICVNTLGAGDAGPGRAGNHDPWINPSDEDVAFASLTCRATRWSCLIEFGS